MFSALSVSYAAAPRTGASTLTASASSASPPEENWPHWPATRYDGGNPAATDPPTDPIDRQSSRPAFQALLYPAIPHDLHLSKQTPPAFLACGANDRQDISEGLPQLYLQMKSAGVPAELHIFAGVGHGFGIRKTNTGNVSTWPDLFYGWLRANGFIATK